MMTKLYSLTPFLVGVTGISVKTAHKVFDMINAGATLASILGLIGASGGILGLSGAALWWFLKRQATKLGEAAFVTW
ncbi:circular bacteriocin, circularin A/uberolysin family [Staphylococcus chromogenes]|uniref:circular bacteriocin, circularin A/uberolysin family n=1 Tax=Staphylococcus chromogenes TaxID=46126 RepID=UPI00118785EE|nr:circular bacteriocin, circularin A/uberolysin family [Staphylococcus chromogenes]QDW92494.1 circular bacteriocin, circularin A/uberolysin family [Staphylococcus chromogenes]QDX01512.1 circular bacteriocin, circularin A/uberolysin family [Staphylococcus chromogenes]